jgi:hypothetical protein
MEPPIAATEHSLRGVGHAVAVDQVPPALVVCETAGKGTAAASAIVPARKRFLFINGLLFPRTSTHM